MTTITVENWGLSFTGTVKEAWNLVEELRAAYSDAGSDMGKTLNDFVFSIEMELQNAGFLDENFTRISK